ncbi:hypothetical protein [Mesoterricola sediminis]|uniref:Uncharacterized protein n=1 Tax=Mesoterricola sediminis TaxID=2927980 RepID=A0AA48KHD7_9BACT|nr:hypothetical protein [Mesoterricola sediminis]BDU78278.1 hypothetical protein METESE_32360 [Mesoterricola sediminis]
MNPGGRIRRLALPGAAAGYAALLFGATALLQQGLFERDGYFHARFAWMMPVRGLSRAFPWTQLSTWRDRFCDKEFLYHLLMAPFARIGDDPILGARILSVLLAAAVLGALAVVLRAHRARAPLAFALLPLAAGGLFIARLGMIRSHVLSMLLLVVGVHLLLKRSVRGLFLLGFLYAWSYTVPFVLAMTAAPFALGVWAAGGRLPWKLPAAAALGAVAGLALHPYTPLTLETFLTYVQVFRLGMQGAGTSGFELGNELYPYPLAVFLDIYPLLAAEAVLLAAALAGFRRRLGADALGLGAAALAWFGLTLATPRFAEYSVLLVAAACALVVRDLLPALEARLAARRWARLAGGVLAWAVLAGFHARSLTFYAWYQSTGAPPRFFTGACAWMAANLPPGERVVNLFWDDFPELYYDGYRQTYLWGLDPTYTIREDPARARLLEDLRLHRAVVDGPRIAAAFGARYLVLRKARADRFPEFGGPGFRRRYGDDRAVVLELETGVTPPGRP